MALGLRSLIAEVDALRDENERLRERVAALTAAMVVPVGQERVCMVCAVTLPADWQPNQHAPYCSIRAALAAGQTQGGAG